MSDEVKFINCVAGTKDFCKGYRAGQENAWDTAIRAQCPMCAGDDIRVTRIPSYRDGKWVHQNDRGFYVPPNNCEAGKLHEARRKGEKK